MLMVLIAGSVREKELKILMVFIAGSVREKGLKILMVLIIEILFLKCFTDQPLTPKYKVGLKKKKNCPLTLLAATMILGSLLNTQMANSLFFFSKSIEDP